MLTHMLSYISISTPFSFKFVHFPFAKDFLEQVHVNKVSFSTGVMDTDSSVFCTDPDPYPDPSINKQIKSMKNLISTSLRLLFEFLSMKTDVNVTSKSNKQKKNLNKNLIFVGICQPLTKKAGSGSGSTSQ
jgi:hypothetical protein